MKIKKTKISETESNLNLHLEKKDYIDKFDSQLKDLKRKANLKGFRPGMVPIQLLKNMYGKSVLLEEINKIVSESINNYIKENRIKIIGEPKPQKNDNIDKRHDLPQRDDLVPFAKSLTMRAYRIHMLCK